MNGKRAWLVIYDELGRHAEGYEIAEVSQVTFESVQPEPEGLDGPAAWRPKVVGRLSVEGLGMTRYTPGLREDEWRPAEPEPEPPLPGIIKRDR